MSVYGELIVATVIAVGLSGIVIPVLPGTLLIGAAVLVWALVVGGSAWAVFAAAAGVLAVGEVIKYLLAGRSLRAHGIPSVTVAAGGIVGIIGFFVVPVIGLLLGFVAGAGVSELVRTRSAPAARQGTIAAVRAAAVTMGVELSAGLLAAGLWAAGAVWL